MLGHYDYQFSPANHFSIRGLGSRNHTNGFTGGQGQTETPYSIGTAENFVNQGIGGVFALTTVLGRKVNELRVEVSGETRKRHAIYNGAPQILINQTGMSFGQRFYLPGNNDAGKLQAADNFSYSFGKHDMKFGGDTNTFTDRKDIFAGWSVGEYEFNTLCDFEPSTTAPWCAGYTGTVPAAPNPYFFIQGIGLNGTRNNPTAAARPALPRATPCTTITTGSGPLLAGQMADHPAHHADLRSPLGRHLVSAAAIRHPGKHRLDRRRQFQQDRSPRLSAFRTISRNGVRA